MKNNHQLSVGRRLQPGGLLRSLLVTASTLLFATAAFAAGRQVLHGHVPDVVAHLQPKGDVSPSAELNLTIGLPLRNQEALVSLLRDIYDPGSLAYHNYLTPTEFTEQFAPSEQDYQAVIAFAEANGLTVTATHANRLLLEVSGSAGDIEKVLHVTLRLYDHPTESRQFFAPDTEPSLDVTVPILRIRGLDSLAVPHPCVHKTPLPGGQGPVPNGGRGPGGTYAGGDFRIAYASGSSLYGFGQAVGLLEFDGYKASDITHYETEFNTALVPLSNVLLNGFNGLPISAGGELEVSLDIEMAASLAPELSSIIVYMTAPGNNALGEYEGLLNRMATDNLAKQLSSSWFLNESLDDPVTDSIFQEMAAQGQSFFCASGDSDAYTAPIPYPCDNPYITIVGGTTLTLSNSLGEYYVGETVWNWWHTTGQANGSSGGISTIYTIPNWQMGINMSANQGSTTMRNTPDVAMTADNVYVRSGGQDYNVGGTSCAAPLWAAFTALANQQAGAGGLPPLGFLNPAIYAVGMGPNYDADFHDITTGDNTSPSSPSKFFAVTGYDLCTGWGTPNGQSLINALANEAPRCFVTAPASIVAWWPGQGTANDILNANNGTLENTAGFAQGEVGNAFNLDGSRGYVLVNASSSLDVGQSGGFTIEGWINPTTVANEAPIAEYERVLGTQNGSDVGVQFWISSYNGAGCLFANIVDTADANHIFTSSAGLVKAGAWQHVALTYDKGSGVAIIYLNGSQVASQNLGSFTPQTSFYFLLGARTTFGSASNPKNAFPGGLDELSLYNSALGASEIQSIFVAGRAGKCAQAPGGLISWWAGENSPVDSIGGNNGSLANTAGFAPGQVGTGFSLDGSRGYVLINASSTLNAGQGGGFTLGGWINPTTVANEAPIAEYERVLGTQNGSDVGVQFWISSYNGAGCLFANIVDTAGANHIFTTSAGLVTAGAWQHVALTYDNASGVATIYLNGSPVATQALGSFTPQTSFNLLLGARTTFGSASNPRNAFPGGLDEMALYGRALKTTEILQVYSAGSEDKWLQ